MDSIQVYIDLEGVLIDDWHSRLILYHKAQSIQQIISQYEVNYVTLFSYAIDNIRDFIEFNKYAHSLELTFDFTFDDVLTVEEIMDVARFNKHMWEFKLNGKRDGFIQYATAMVKNTDQLCTFVLIDDNVNDEVVEVSDKLTVIFHKV